MAFGDYKDKRINIIKDIDNIEIHNFENQFIQFLINFFKNSSDIFEEKEIEERLIFITSKVLDKHIYITIQDSGGGIDEKIMARVFEPYFTTKHQFQGTGMGLYMSEEIITKLMNGSIDVKNEEVEYGGKVYKGAKFLIVLPILN